MSLDIPRDGTVSGVFMCCLMVIIFPVLSTGGVAGGIGVDVDRGGDGGCFRVLMLTSPTVGLEII